MDDVMRSAAEMNEVMTELHRRVQERGYDLSEFREGDFYSFVDAPEPLPEERDISGLEKMVQDVSENWAISHETDLGSGMKGSMKKVMQRLMNFEIMPLFHQQRLYNDCVRGAIDHIYRHIQNLYNRERALGSLADSYRAMSSNDVFAFFDAQESRTEELQTRVDTLENELQELRARLSGDSAPDSGSENELQELKARLSGGSAPDAGRG